MAVHQPFGKSSTEFCLKSAMCVRSLEGGEQRTTVSFLILPVTSALRKGKQGSCYSLAAPLSIDLISLHCTSAVIISPDTFTSWNMWAFRDNSTWWVERNEWQHFVFSCWIFSQDRAPICTTTTATTHSFFTCITVSSTNYLVWVQESLQPRYVRRSATTHITQNTPFS